MEESVKKKKKHWILRILLLLLLLILVAAAILSIWLVPRARRLQRALTAQNCAITAEVSLNRQTLTEEQQKLLQSLSLLTGLDEADWEKLKLQGGYDAGTIELAVYDGQDALFTRLYLTQDCQAVDLHSIYDRACDHLTEQIGLLSHVLPQWSLGDYVALQQLEYAFGFRPGNQGFINFPDLQGMLENLQSRLSLPMLCGAVLAADQWDRESQELVYHITASDRRLALARQIAGKTGRARETESWQLPEGAALDVVIYLGEPQVRMRVTGKLPEVKQLTDWSLELTWDGYSSTEAPISLVDQQMINGLAELLKLLEVLCRQSDTEALEFSTIYENALDSSGTVQDNEAGEEMAERQEDGGWRVVGDYELPVSLTLEEESKYGLYQAMVKGVPYLLNLGRDGVFGFDSGISSVLKLYNAEDRFYWTDEMLVLDFGASDTVWYLQMQDGDRWNLIFREDLSTHPEGGALQDGTVFEKIS